MSKAQHGNREAKKPKLVRLPVKPQTAAELAQTVAVAPLERPKRK